jgi:predicted permease
LTDNWGELVLVQGHQLPKPGESAGASWDRVSSNYLQRFGATMLRGRAFNSGDTETTENVAIVNEGFVKRFFKSDEDPLGRHFGLDLPENAGTYRIVGVVRDMKFAGFALRQPARPMFYVPLAQMVDYKQPLMQRIEIQSHFVGGLMLATSLAPGGLEPVLTRTLAEIDPNLTITSVRTMEEQVALTFDEERAVASLAGLFGFVALILAAIGIYGVTAYSVAQRTNEIGIRMALGATRGGVVDLVLRGAFARVALGLVLGLPLAVGAGRLISAQLYGVVFWDPVALSVAAGSLGVCAFVAAIVPAGRAARLSPMRALRME